MEDRRRHHLGWYSFDPELNLMYYGTGNPSTWNPKQRPGDNNGRWPSSPAMVDNGMAKWVYQMTPPWTKKWDSTGSNEMILADQNIGGAAAQDPRAIRPQRLRLHARPRHRRIAGAEKYDPSVNWATKVDMDKTSKTYGRRSSLPKFSTTRMART